MLKSIWAGPTDQTTPKASLQSNPFDAPQSSKTFSSEKHIKSSPASSRKNSIASTIGPRTPTSKGFHFFENQKEVLQAPPSPFLHSQELSHPEPSFKPQVSIPRLLLQYLKLNLPLILLLILPI